MSINGLQDNRTHVVVGDYEKSSGEFSSCVRRRRTSSERKPEAREERMYRLVWHNTRTGGSTRGGQADGDRERMGRLRSREGSVKEGRRPEDRSFGLCAHRTCLHRTCLVEMQHLGTLEQAAHPDNAAKREAQRTWQEKLEKPVVVFSMAMLQHKRKAHGQNHWLTPSQATT